MKKKHKKISKRRNSGYQYLSLIVVVVLVIFLGVGLLIHSYAASDDASFTLSPTSGSYNVGATVTLAISETSASTDDVNAVEANLTYSTSELSYVSTTLTGSFTICAENSGGSGSVTIACASSTTVSGSQPVADVTFSTTAVGSPSIDMVSGTGIDNSSGTSVWNGVLPTASYTVVAAPPTVSISGLSTDSYIHSNAMPVDATATANDGSGGSISKCVLYASSTAVQTITASPYDFSLDTLNYANGYLTIEVECTDNLSNIGTDTLTTIVNNGDLTDAGSVGLSDLAVMSSHWGQTDSNYADGNITGQSTINVSDLSILAANWGWKAP